MADFRLAPDSWTLRPGVTVEVFLTNRGSSEHDWTVLFNPIATESELTDLLVISAVEVNAGAQSTVDFRVPPAGTYQVVCSIPTHKGWWERSPWRPSELAGSSTVHA